MTQTPTHAEPDEEEYPLFLFGKELGVYSDLERVDDFDLQFYDVKLNALGRNFFPNFPEAPDACLCFDLQAGTAQCFIDNTNPDAPTVINLSIHWSALDEEPTP